MNLSINFDKAMYSALGENLADSLTSQSKL